MKRLILLMAVPMLAACATEEHEDIKVWMREATKDLKAQIAPLPEITTFKVSAYEAADAVDPFQPARIEPEKKGGAAGGLLPDFNRRKEPLEMYPLESLKMVGVLEQKQLNFGLVLADATVHRVKIGNYLGQNFGIITDIDENEIKLKELVQDPSGEWVERSSTLQLQQVSQEARK